MAYYPVTAAEIGAAAARIVTDSNYPECTMAVREDVTTRDGRTFPMLAYGSPTCYVYHKHNGKVYGVRSWDIEDGSAVFAE